MWNPDFAASLTRLAEFRGRRAFPGLDGPPRTATLQHIATDLDVHAADLFALAGLPLPESLSPVDRTAGDDVDDLVRLVMRGDAPARSRLLAEARSMVQSSQSLGFTPISSGTGPGATIRAMLHVRNLNVQVTAMVMRRMTGRYEAGSVIVNVCNRPEWLTPDWLADIGTVLGTPPGLLSAMIGMPVANVPRPAWTADGAELIWAVRRLTHNQTRALINAMRAS